MNTFSNNNQIKQFMELFGVFNDPIIGIDISSSAVKVMEISKYKEQNVIKSFGIEQLNVGDVTEKNIKNKDAVVLALKKALAKARITSRLGCIAIPSSLAITKVVQLAKGLTQEEIINEIEVDSDRYIPYELEDVNLDFEILGEAKNADNLVDLLLVATKKENVKTRSAILEAAGIKPHIIDVESLAVERIFQLIAPKLPAQAKNRIVGCFDLGATTTSLHVFHDLRLVYTKEQAFGGQQLLDEIQKRYGLTWSEAILAIKHQDLPDDYSVDVLEPYRLKVAQQINRLCQLFISSSEYSKLDDLCITGGTSNLIGLDDAISELTKTKVILINPIANLTIDKSLTREILEEEAFGLLNCCGLALRNCARKIV